MKFVPVYSIIPHYNFIFVIGKGENGKYDVLDVMFSKAGYPDSVLECLARNCSPKNAITIVASQNITQLLQKRQRQLKETKINFFFNAEFYLCLTDFFFEINNLFYALNQRFMNQYEMQIVGGVFFQNTKNSAIEYCDIMLHQLPKSSPIIRFIKHNLNRISYFYYFPFETRMAIGTTNLIDYINVIANIAQIGYVSTDPQVRYPRKAGGLNCEPLKAVCFGTA